MVKDKAETKDYSTLYLDDRVLGNPALAMDLVTKELTRMAEMGQEMMAVAKDAFMEGDLKKIQKVNQLEDWLDYLQVEITKYLSKMLSNGSLTELQGDRLAGLMHITHDIERIGDHCQNIAEFAQTKEDRKFSFSKEAIFEITKAFTLLNSMVDDSINALKSRNTYLANKVLSKEYEVDKMELDLRGKHIERLNNGSCDHEAGIIFIELIHNIERIADHCNNIAEAVIEDSTIKGAAFE